MSTVAITRLPTVRFSLMLEFIMCMFVVFGLRFASDLTRTRGQSSVTLTINSPGVYSRARAKNFRSSVCHQLL